MESWVEKRGSNHTLGNRLTGEAVETRPDKSERSNAQQNSEQQEGSVRGSPKEKLGGTRVSSSSKSANAGGPLGFAQGLSEVGAASAATNMPATHRVAGIGRAAPEFDMSLNMCWGGGPEFDMSLNMCWGGGGSVFVVVVVFSERFFVGRKDAGSGLGRAIRKRPMSEVPWLRPYGGLIGAATPENNMGHSGGWSVFGICVVDVRC
jgi:hypothetical protein